MAEICQDCKKEVVTHSQTPFCKDCAGNFFNPSGGFPPAKINNAYPNQFFDYSDGVRISEDEVKEWLNDAKKDLLELDVLSCTISSGDTIVFAQRKSEEGYVDVYNFIVANKEGYKEINLTEEELKVTTF